MEAFAKSGEATTDFEPLFSSLEKDSKSDK